MDATRDYHTKWSESERKRQTPYDIAYMRNLNYDTKEPMYAPAEAEHIKRSMCVTFEKLAQAAHTIGILPADIEDYFRDQTNPKSTSTGFSLYGLNSPAEIAAYTREMAK